MFARLIIGSIPTGALLLAATAAPASGAADAGDPAELATGEADGGVEASTLRHSPGDAGPPIDWLDISPSRYVGVLSGYDSTVSAREPTSLGAENYRPWAVYLNAMHNRVHPIFVDQFLARLDRLAGGDALNEKTLMVRLEIALDGGGRIARLGVVRSSGLTAFDLGALDAVSRAGPFGRVLPGLLSADGMMYAQWEFHRDPVFACSTKNARPYHLSGSPFRARVPLCPTFKYVISDAGREYWGKNNCDASEDDAGLRD